MLIVFCITVVICVLALLATSEKVTNFIHRVQAVLLIKKIKEENEKHKH